MAGSSTTRSRTRKTAPKKAAADPLPITAAELDGLDGEFAEFGLIASLRTAKADFDRRGLCRDERRPATQD